MPSVIPLFMVMSASMVTKVAAGTQEIPFLLAATQGLRPDDNLFGQTNALVRNWRKSLEASSSLLRCIEYGYGMGGAVNFEVAHVFERLFMGEVRLRSRETGQTKCGMVRII